MKILIVDDDKDAQFIFSRLLRKNGFDVAVVNNGVEAVDITQKEKFSLIIMDTCMPVMDGIEATKKIREMSEYKETPIIAATTLSSERNKKMFFEAGATGYILKPFDSKDFIEMVKKYTSS